MVRRSVPPDLDKLLQKSNTVAVDLRQQLQQDPTRFASFSREFSGLLFDFSRVAATQDTLADLAEAAQSNRLSAAIDGLFAGEVLNPTENRQVLHHLWRSGDFSAVLDASQTEYFENSARRAERLAEQLHQRQLPGVGQPIESIVHVGIGGSLLGPELLYEALAAEGRGPQVHFLSSVDALPRERLLRNLDPAATVVVLVSKSFSTAEVLAHAKRLAQWQDQAIGREQRLLRWCAVTASPQRAVGLGLAEERVLDMGSWTGGRFSLWSPVSLSVMARIGTEPFRQFLAGGAALDSHFRNTPPMDNLPILHGMISCWHRNICGYPARGLIPYDSRLRRLPAWLQQLQMESNGKSVSLQGDTLGWATAPLVIGEVGTDAQHALFQAFHQGPDVVPLDLIGIIKPDHDDFESQQVLLAHLLAQATALALGRDLAELQSAIESAGGSAAGSSEDGDAQIKHRVMPGRRPSSILLLDRLDAYHLGVLLALYEHSVFVESRIWRINAFDQWGVELGKEMADRIVPRLRAGGSDPGQDLPGLGGVLDYIRSRTGQVL